MKRGTSSWVIPLLAIFLVFLVYVFISGIEKEIKLAPGEIIYVIDGETYYLINGDLFWLNSTNGLEFFLHIYDIDYIEKNYFTSNGIIYQNFSGVSYPTKNSFSEDFEGNSSIWDFFGIDDGWHTTNADPAQSGPGYYYNVGSRINISNSIVHSGSQSFYSYAPINAKAGIRRGLFYYSEGNEIWFSGWFYVPNVDLSGGFTLLDIESDWLYNSPGMRLIFDNNKIVYELKWLENIVYRQNSTGTAFPMERWVNLRGYINLSSNITGKAKLWQDDVLVVNSTGQTLPLSDTVYTSVEIGVTMSGTTATAAKTVYVDDFVISSNCSDVFVNCNNAQCGNGIIETGEQCDDNNFINGDGCNSNCFIENGMGCIGQPSVCGACQFLNANWELASVIQGRIVKLTVNTNQYCEQKLINFSIGDASMQPSQTIVANSITERTWESEVGGNYTFRALLNEEPNIKIDSGILNVINDSFSPVVNLIMPDDSDVLDVANVEFEYGATDGSSINNCTLHVGQELIIDNQIENDLVNRFSISLEDGDYLWNVSCVDKFNNKGESETRNIRVERQVSVNNVGGNTGGGNTGGGGNSNISQPDIQNIDNTTANDNTQRISLVGDEVGLIDIGNIESVLLNLNGEQYEIIFETKNDGVLLKGPNGDYLIPKDDILPVMLGGQEMYVGVKRLDASGAGIILGLNRELVQEQLAESLSEGKKKISTAYIVIGIIIVLMAVISLALYFIIKRNKSNYTKQL